MSSSTKNTVVFSDPLAYAVSNVGEHNGRAALPEDYAEAIISSRANDLPWIEPKDYHPAKSGALQGVGWPMFAYNLPRLDDRNF